MELCVDIKKTAAGNRNQVSIKEFLLLSYKNQIVEAATNKPMKTPKFVKISKYFHLLVNGVAATFRANLYSLNLTYKNMYGEMKIKVRIREIKTYLKNFLFEKKESIKIMNGKNTEKNFVKKAIASNKLKTIIFLSEIFFLFFNFK